MMPLERGLACVQTIKRKMEEEECMPVIKRRVKSSPSISAGVAGGTEIGLGKMVELRQPPYYVCLCCSADSS